MVQVYVEDLLKDPKNSDPSKRLRLMLMFAYFPVSNISCLPESGALTREGHERSQLGRGLRALDTKKVGEIASVYANELNDPSPGAAVETEGTCRTANILTRDESLISSITVYTACDLAFSIFNYTLSDQHWEQSDECAISDVLTNFLPHIHIMMVFICNYSLTTKPSVSIERFIDWTSICRFLNRLAIQAKVPTEIIFQDKFPEADIGSRRPLWEDFLLRGLLFTGWYFPASWFSGIDVEESELELPGMDLARVKRIIWLGRQIAAVRELANREWLSLTWSHQVKVLRYDTSTSRFENVRARNTSGVPHFTWELSADRGTWIN